MGSPGSSALARLHLQHCGGRHRRRLLPGLWQPVSGRVWGGAGGGRAWRRSGRGGKGRSPAGEAAEGGRSQCGARQQRVAEGGGGQCGVHGRRAAETGCPPPHHGHSRRERRQRSSAPPHGRSGKRRGGSGRRRRPSGTASGPCSGSRPPRSRSSTGRIPSPIVDPNRWIRVTFQYGNGFLMRCSLMKGDESYTLPLLILDLDR